MYIYIDIVNLKWHTVPKSPMEMISKFYFPINTNYLVNRPKLMLKIIKTQQNKSQENVIETVFVF